MPVDPVAVLTGTILPSWEPVILLAAFTTFLFVTILYMFSFVFNLQPLKQWCKSEYAQVLVTFLIAIFLIALITWGIPVTMQFTGSTMGAVGMAGYPSGIALEPFEIARAYTNTTINCATGVYRWIYYINSFVEVGESINLDIGGSEAAMAWHLSGIVGAFHIIENRLTYVMLIQYMFYRLLDFFQATMFTFFLPAGLILRTFPLTRGVGGFLIALAIGGYIIFPLAFVVVVALQGNIASSCTVNFNALPGIQRCGDSLTDAYATQEYVRQNLPLITGYMQDASNKVAMIFLQSVFFPLVALIIFFTFVRQTSSLMGADLAELGTGLIKII